MVPATKAQIIARSLKNTISQLTYPMYQLIIQIAEKYTAATAADWTNLDGVSAAPVTQDAAIEILVDAVGASQSEDKDPIVLGSGIHEVVAGATTDTIALVGLAVTDVVLVTIHTLDAGSRSLVSAVAGAGAITLTFSGVLGAGGKVNYLVISPK